MVLGIAAGGSGLSLAAGSSAYSKAGMIAYAVLAGISGVSLVWLCTWVEVKKRGSKKAETEGSVMNGV